MPMMLRPLAALAFLFLSVSWPLATIAQESGGPTASTVIANPFAGKTVRFLSEKYGSGVIYFDADGRAFIWHPGRIDVSVGVWRKETFRITQQPGTADETVSVTHAIAVQFPEHLESNPVLTAFSDLFAYLDANNMAGDLGVTEAAEGDAMGLADLTPPCRLCRADMTFAQMKRL